MHTMKTGISKGRDQRRRQNSGAGRFYASEKEAEGGNQGQPEEGVEGVDGVGGEGPVRASLQAGG